MKFKLLILDFDDTLFPSYLLKTTQNLHPNEIVQIDDVACKIITTYISFDFHIVIITNSQLAWYNMITQQYLPNLSLLVKNLSIKVISANDIYSCIYPEDFIKWKICAYEDYILKHLLIDGYEGYVKSNLKYTDICVLSVGDSHIDMLATSHLNTCNVSKLCNIQTKFIKYQDNPTIQIILDQSNFFINNASLIDNLITSVTLYINLPDPFSIPDQSDSLIIKQPIPIFPTQNNDDTIFEFSDLGESQQEIHSPPKRQTMNYEEEIFYTKQISTEPYF